MSQQQLRCNLQEGGSVELSGVRWWTEVTAAERATGDCLHVKSNEKIKSSALGCNNRLNPRLPMVVFDRLATSRHTGVEVSADDHLRPSC